MGLSCSFEIAKLIVANDLEIISFVVEMLPDTGHGTDSFFLCEEVALDIEAAVASRPFDQVKHWKEFPEDLCTLTACRASAKFLCQLAYCMILSR